MKKEIIALGMSIVLITTPVFAGPPGGSPPGGSGSVTWSGATEITGSTTASNKTYKSTSADENAVLINTSGNVVLNTATITKTGGTSASDTYSFYGTNSAVMCKGGGTTTIKRANVTTKAAGANGVFCYGGNASTNASSGDGTTVVISDSTITTTGDGSGGIMTTGYGIMKASDLKINTSGNSSAAIRSDRGGGIVTVDGGSYTTSGIGSPAIYATATITVSNAALTSTASQGVVNEGGNKVILNNCTVNAGNKTLNSQDYFRNGIFLYQSMSGDASDGASVFSMTGGTINNTYGHVFHVTNTSAAITLNNVNIKNSDSENVFLSVCDDAWSGLSNSVTLKAQNQAISGKILVGSDSTATVNLSGSSSWNGITSGNITSHKNSKTVSSSLGTVNVTLGSGSLWVLTGDCKVTSISGSGKINYNGHTLTVGSKKYSSGSPGGSITETTESASDVSNDTGDSAGTSNTTGTSDTADSTTSTDDTAKSSTVKATIKASKTTVKRGKKTVIKITSNSGAKLTVKAKDAKAKNKKYVKISSGKTAKITFTKKAAKGVYKFTVTSPANGNYKKTSKTIKIVVK